MTGREYLKKMNNEELAGWMINHFINTNKASDEEAKLVVKVLTLALEAECKDGCWITSTIDYDKYLN